MVGILGLEPRSLAALDFESSVFTNFTISPKKLKLFDMPYLNLHKNSEHVR